MGEFIIEVKDAVKHFGHVRALNGINLQVHLGALRSLAFDSCARG